MYKYIELLSYFLFYIFSMNTILQNSFNYHEPYCYILSILILAFVCISDIHFFPNFLNPDIN